MMRVPTEDELAAIAVAYLAVTPPSDEPASAQASRWSLAGRLPVTDAERARFAARSVSRWKAAGRLDG
jgi:hypothetical protein